MNIYDYAMQLEKDGEKYYLEAADSTSRPGLSKILIMLATAEQIHYAVFERMKRNETVTVAGTTIFMDAKNVFVRMREEGGWKGNERFRDRSLPDGAGNRKGDGDFLP